MNGENKEISKLEERERERKSSLLIRKSLVASNPTCLLTHRKQGCCCCVNNKGNSGGSKKGGTPRERSRPTSLFLFLFPFFSPSFCLVSGKIIIGGLGWAGTHQNPPRGQWGIWARVISLLWLKRQCSSLTIVSFGLVLSVAHDKNVVLIINIHFHTRETIKILYKL